MVKITNPHRIYSYMSYGGRDGTHACRQSTLPKPSSKCMLLSHQLSRTATSSISAQHAHKGKKRHISKIAALSCGGHDGTTASNPTLDTCIDIPNASPRTIKLTILAPPATKSPIDGEHYHYERKVPICSVAVISYGIRDGTHACHQRCKIHAPLSHMRCII